MQIRMIVRAVQAGCVNGRTGEHALQLVESV
jgi:hypothetical protein